MAQSKRTAPCAAYSTFDSGFDKYGHIELHPTRKDWIWIKADDLKLARKKSKKTK